MTDISELVHRIESCEDALHVFEMPQWQTVIQKAQKRLDDHTSAVMNALANTMTPEEVEQRRGQARELQWLIGLESKTRKELSQTQKQLQEEQDQRLSALAE